MFRSHIQSAIPVLLLLAFILVSVPSGAERLTVTQREAREIHKKYPVPYPYYCSSSDNPERYHDAGWRPNEKMLGQKAYIQAAEEYQEWVDSLQAWVAMKRNTFDKKIFGKGFEKANVIHIETPHWKFATNLVGRRMKTLCLGYPLPKWLASELNAEKFNQKKVERLKIKADADLAARIYAERLEYMHKIFLELFEGNMQPEEELDDPWGDEEDEDEKEEEEKEDKNSKKDKNADHDYEISKCSTGGGKLGFYIWRSVQDQKRVSFALVNVTSDTGITQNSVYSLHTKFDKDRGNDEPLLHGVIHCASQVMLSSYIKFQIDAVPNWFDEALGHWMEYKIMKKAIVCTRRELPQEIVIPPTKLRKRVYDMVKSKRDEQLAAFCGKDYDNLTPKQRVQSFGIIDYMIQDSEKMRKWILAVKDHKDQGKAFRDIYDISMDEFQDNWRAWVLDTYKRAKD